MLTQQVQPLNKWLKPMVSEGCVVHSFRHSMRDRLRAVECPKEIIDQIGGWSSSDVGESYGDGFPLDNKIKMVGKSFGLEQKNPGYGLLSKSEKRNSLIHM